MRRLFFLLLICTATLCTIGQTYTNGLTSTGSGATTNVRLGGANPLLVNTTVDLGTFTFGFKKATANYFTIINNGNIGIGTPTPASKLFINNGIPNQQGLIVRGATDQTGNLQEWQNSSSLVRSNMSADGRELTIGIPFSIAGSGNEGAIIIGGQGKLQFFDNNSNTYLFESFGIHATGDGQRPLNVDGTSLVIGYPSDGTFYGTNNALIAGKVGIGIANPTAQLHTTGSVRLTGLIMDDSSNRVLVSDTSGNISYRDFSGLGVGWGLAGNGGTNPVTNFIGSTDSVGIAFRTNNAEQMIISAKGNVGIGNSNPTYKLDVNGNGRFSSDAIINGITVGKGNGNVFTNNAFGTDALFSNTTGTANTAVGLEALYANTTGYNNTAVGFDAGVLNTIGHDNFFGGFQAGTGNTEGFNNVVLGYRALFANQKGSNNFVAGTFAGRFMSDRSTPITKLDNSIFIGYNTTSLSDSLTNQIVIGDYAVGLGSNTTTLGNSSTMKTNLFGKLKLPAYGVGAVTGTAKYNLATDSSGNIIEVATSAGSSAGWALTGNTGTNPVTNFIGTSDSVGLAFRTNNSTKLFIGASGSVGIGTQSIADSNYKLFVETGILTRRVRVDAATTVWADYVFDKDYKLLPLSEVDKFIQQNKHLPGVLSAKEVKMNGIDLGENQATLLKKVEELTLYLIEINKKVETLVKENELLKKK